MREAKLPSDRRAVFYLLFLLCLLVPGAVFAGDDGAEASTDDEESSDGDTEVEEVDEDSEGEPRADYGGAATSRDEAVDSAAAGPEEGWDLSRQELAELEALEALAPTIPGAALCTGHGGGAHDGLQIALKGGQMGSEDFFGWIRDGGGPR